MTDFRKPSYITRKQINVIYSNAKNGKLSVEKGFMSALYYATEPSFDRTESERSRDLLMVKDILDAIFASKYEDAQKIISKEQSEYYSLLGKKGIAAYNKEIVR